MKQTLPLWAEEQLKFRFGDILLEKAEWEVPKASSSLKCIAYIAIKCPFEASHECKHRKNNTETILMVNSSGGVMVFCHHSSCTQNLHKLNALLRANQWSAWFANEIESEPQRTSPEEIKRIREERGKAEEFRKEADRVSAEPLPLDKLAALSPSPVANLKADQMTRRHLSLFPPQDLIWVGNNPYQSKSSTRFKTAEQFVSDVPSDGVFIAGSSFKSASEGRRSGNLDKRRFCIFENDQIGKERTAALLLYTQSKGLKLAAVVDSGGKSAHGWVVEDKDTEKWRSYFKACGFCSRAMRATQPVRLAGAIRHFEDGREPVIQRLLYLNEGVLPWRT